MNNHIMAITDSTVNPPEIKISVALKSGHELLIPICSSSKGSDKDLKIISSFLAWLTI